MVQTNRCVISAVTILSGVATTFLLISLATEQWVTALGKFNNDETANTLSTIKYGLFSGTFLPQPKEPTYEIKMTCSISENACAYLCEATPELRKNQLARLINRQNVTFNNTCPHMSKKAATSSRLNKSIHYKLKSVYNPEFLNAGLYISTNIFLGIAVLFGLISTVFAIWILIVNPTDISLSICGVYTYNIVACVSCLLTLILWGILFGINIINNVGILYTIQEQMDTEGMVNLGFSYWLILPSCLFYLISIVLIHTRQYPVSPELETTIILISGGNEVEFSCG